MQNLFSVADVANRIGIPEHRITYAHRIHRLADAPLRIAGKRIYTEADLYRIAKYFGVQPELISRKAPPNNPTNNDAQPQQETP